MSAIKSIIPRKIIDSDAQWAVEVNVVLSDGKQAKASVSAGISAGKLEKPKVNADQALIEIKRRIAPQIEGVEATNQEKIDNLLANLICGANSTLAVSMAVCKAAQNLSLPQKPALPKLMMLLIEGGKHSEYKNPSIQIQEYMGVFNSIKDGIRVYNLLRQNLLAKNYTISIGKEGGITTNDLNDNQVLDFLNHICNNDFLLAIDAAAEHHSNLLDYSTWLSRYPIFSIEDACEQTNLGGWQKLMAKYGQSHLIAGDDLTVTNPLLIEKAAQNHTCNAVIIKPDQNGTISGTLKAVETARKYGLKIIVSHRGRETNETFLADFALAIKADYVKFGGPTRGERVAKYNRLLECIA